MTYHQSDQTGSSSMVPKVGKVQIVNAEGAVMSIQMKTFELLIPTSYDREVAIWT